MGFDIDNMTKLAQQDSKEFERRAKKIVEDFISISPDEHNKGLREIQGRINGKKSFYKADLPEESREFEIERRALIDQFLHEAEGEEIFYLINDLQVIIDKGLGRALFDLKRLEELAEKDLDLFDKEKEILVLRFILSQPPDKRHKAKQSQWKIDSICKTGKNRLDRLMKFQTLFYSEVYGNGGFVETLQSLGPANQKFQEATAKAVQKKKDTKRKAYLKVIK